MFRTIYLTILCLIHLLSFAQKGTVQGTIRDETGKSLEVISVSVREFPTAGTTTDENGNYQISVPADQQIILLFSHISYQMESRAITVPANGKATVDVTMKIKSHTYGEVNVEAVKDIEVTMERINPKIVGQLPSASGSFESVLFTQLGVASNNETTSQYSVRGGNFDENLIYVNDVQIYRPFLVRAGQQEGLSFINADLVESVLFSAGGFEAQYGDKMSSVLDVRYKEPVKFAGSVSASLLGGSAHIETASDDHRLTQLYGIRYRTNQYLLGSLDTDGEYQPTFFDFQSYHTYDLSDDLELGLLLNVSQNKYRFVPESRQSEFGTISQALRLTVYFEGQEVDEFTTGMGAMSFKYKPTDDLTLKFIGSAFKTRENETFDILGQYWLDELERDLSKDNFGDKAFNRGVGSYLHHARNYLDAMVYSAEHKGERQFERNTVLWGLKYQHEDILDELHEWKLIDSSGYSLPHQWDNIGYTHPADRPYQELRLSEAYKADNLVISDRVMAYLQDNFNFGNDSIGKFRLTAGVRLHHWTWNKQLLVAPRTTLAFKPRAIKNLTLRLAAGVYHQPAFYREMRDLYGNVNPNIKAQTSIHFIAGGDKDFNAWNRPFRLTSELYYKILRNLVPYEIDNVRLRYYATNNANGDAMGVDMKINGEFVRGTESWASISVMRVREDIKDDYYYVYYNQSGEKIVPGYTADQAATDSVRHQPGYIPRPTDRRLNFGLYFQDYIPKHPRYKMNLNLLYGTGFPFGPPSYERYKDTLRIPPYRRVDIGFSAQLLQEDDKIRASRPFRYFNSIWASLEVFNLLQINNTISYMWIKDVTGTQYAIPNYLTNRRINVKLTFNF